jgi:RimJ/RimL family protein N-acetyltransferase
MAEVIAETERLILREWDDHDEARFYHVINTPAVMQWLGGLQTPEEWNAGYQRIRAYQRDLGFTFWIVERQDDSAILGFCGLKRANAPGAEAIAGDFEIGWRLREDAWGQGYAREAALASPRVRSLRCAARGWRYGAPQQAEPGPDEASRNAPSRRARLHRRALLTGQ